MATQTFHYGTGQTYTDLASLITDIVTGGITSGDDYLFVQHGSVTDNNSPELNVGDGWDVASSINFMAYPGEEHTGQPNTGISLTRTSNYGAAINIIGVEATILGLEVASTGTGGIAINCYNSSLSTTLHLDSCIVRDSNDGIDGLGANSTIIRSLIANNARYGIYDRKTYKAIQLARCVLAGNGTAVQSGSGVSYTGGQNVFYGNTTDWNGTGTWTDGYNASDAVTPPGPDAISTALVSGDFTDAANDDYSLSSTSATPYHAGIPITGLDTDIVGNSYDSSTPSIGPFELPAAGGSVPPPVFQNANQQVTS